MAERSWSGWDQKQESEAQRLGKLRPKKMTSGLPHPSNKEGRKERDTATAHPQPLTSASLQPEGPSITNEEAHQQLQRGPGRRKLCLTWKGQGAASESPHMAKVPERATVGRYRSVCHSISGSAPPPEASRDARQRNTAVTKCRFTCPMHGEAKQHTSEFGAEKGLPPGPHAGSHNCNGGGRQDPSGSYSANSRQRRSPVREAAVTLGCSLWDPAPACTARGAWGPGGSWAPGSLGDDGWRGRGPGAESATS